MESRHAVGIAAGGGGDVITAAVLLRTLWGEAEPVVLSFSWDRLIVDPVPGPRSVSDFQGILRHAENIWEITPETSTVAPAYSTLPRLAHDLNTRIVLLDPYQGTAGIAAQITETAAFFGASEVVLADVGGDVIASGREATLRSPIADFSALEAAHASGIPAQVVVAGPGLDGELTEHEVLTQLHTLGAQEVAKLTGDAFGPYRGVFEWHPSEASGLLAAAAQGIRGSVEIRDIQHHIALTDTSPTVFTVDFEKLYEASPAKLLHGTNSLAQIETTVRRVTGRSELTYETEKAQQTQADTRPPHPITQQTLKGYLDTAVQRGADYLTIRHIAEHLGATTQTELETVRDLIQRHYTDKYTPPLVPLKI